ncbi:hypothetical protein [Shewanella litoralis]|uniref:hypothetical protein n=1 Tax=Shewanella litoralis TaxID=2282700 RepID=UPI001356C114|nr:hypothetical protein [Shewanella litoralis]
MLYPLSPSSLSACIKDPGVSFDLALKRKTNTWIPAQNHCRNDVQGANALPSTPVIFKPVFFQPSSLSACIRDPGVSVDVALMRKDNTWIPA